MNTSNSDNFIGTSKLPRIKVQNYSQFNTLINLKKITYTKSSVSINDEITDEKFISEEISYNQNSAEIIDHTFYYNVMNLLDTKEEADVTSIHFVNATNDISMNDDENFIHEYYAPFFGSKNHEDVSSG